MASPFASVRDADRQVIQRLLLPDDSRRAVERVAQDPLARLRP